MSIKYWPLAILTVAFWACTDSKPYMPELPKVPAEESSDTIPSAGYVEYDGLVEQLMKASVGKGLDIVLMGDGFPVELHADGTYRSVMEQACKYLFSVEPTASLKDRFNVYYVGVVSHDSNLDGTSGIYCKKTVPTYRSEEAINTYAKNVSSLEHADSTVFCVIINTRESGGICYHQSYTTQKAYAYCPRIRPSNPTSQDYRFALVHEVIGHGFAKMSDEYVMSGYESTTPSRKERAQLIEHQKSGYDRNITFSTDTASCPWKEFLTDERYASEKIGFYEGVGYYGKGAYRSTKTNLMNVTWGKDMAFSAPDRKIIYDRIIVRSENRKPDYEEFVEFDLNLN